jgi:GrpB-like predicted nucleotidyltransferase (UPF0157 family)
MAKPVTYTTNHKYEIVPYSPDWPKWYEKESALLRNVFKNSLLDIQHVGSTAIPGMAAKPQLDILIQVQDIIESDMLEEAMQAVGYQAYGNALKQGGRMFSRWDGDVKTVNVHVFQADSPIVQRYISVRDFLLTHPKEAEAYAQLKLDLYKKYPSDYLKYRELKDPYIDALRARISQTEQ